MFAIAEFDPTITQVAVDEGFVLVGGYIAMRNQPYLQPKPKSKTVVMLWVSFMEMKRGLCHLYQLHQLYLSNSV